MAVGGILVAAASSLALNTSYAIQHRGLTDGPALDHRRPLASLRTLLRSRRWLGGALLGYAGLALDLLAMTLAPLWVVQSVLAIGLVVVLAVWNRARGRGWRAMAPASSLLGAGLLALALTGSGGRSGIVASPSALVAAGLVTALLTGVVLTRRALAPTARSSIASGILYGATTVGFAAVLTAVRLPTVDTGLALAGAALAATTTTAGFACFQRALQTGEPIAVVTTMTAGMNASAIAGGLALGGAAGLSGSALALRVGGLIALCAAGAVGARDLSGRPATRRAAARGAAPALPSTPG